MKRSIRTSSSSSSTHQPIKAKQKKTIITKKKKRRKRFVQRTACQNQKGTSSAPSDPHTTTPALLQPPTHNPRDLVNRIIPRQLINRPIQPNIILLLRKRPKTRLQRHTRRIRILARRTPKRPPRTIIIVKTISKAILQRILIFPPREEIRVETEARRISVREYEFGAVREAVEPKPEFGADVDDGDGVRGRAHPALRVALEGWVRVGHVREVVVGVEILAVPAGREAHVAGDAAAVESGRDAVGFARAGLDEDCGLAEVGRVVCTAVRVAGDDAEAFGGSDGVADAGAVAWGGSVVGAGVVCVVGGHALEWEEVEFAVVADAVGGG